VRPHGAWQATGVRGDDVINKRIDDRADLRDDGVVRIVVVSVAKSTEVF
jgi:hypothetical protein